LLPSISLIYDNLNGAEREKWLKDVLISFFDDVEMGIPLSAWSKALSEALKFSFMKSAELSGSSFIEFLIEQVLRFIGIAISFGEKQPVDVVVDLLIWIPSKVETLNDAEFLEQISRKLLALLPRSIPILEKYIEDSNSFKIAVDLLKNNKCPDETFLKCFKLLDADAVDLKQFGNIVAARSIKCEAFAVQEKLLALLLELLEDGEI
uniref:Uncharacterized protein n=1 Tax=Panagrolaimus sp. JU765 TaxID=591449 RepID=A0AC34QCF7_9BILA